MHQIASLRIYFQIFSGGHAPRPRRGTPLAPLLLPQITLETPLWVHCIFMMITHANILAVFHYEFSTVTVCILCFPSDSLVFSHFCNTSVYLFRLTYDHLVEVQCDVFVHSTDYILESTHPYKCLFSSLSIGMGVLALQWLYIHVEKT